MTVREHFEAAIPGYPVQSLGATLANAAFSPALAKPKLDPPLQAISLDDDISDHLDDEVWMASLNYALSTLYYSMSGVFSGGSRTEQDGDVRASLSGFIITKDDREYYRSMGDKLRKEAGYEPEEPVQETGGMFDATGLRTPQPKRRWSL